MLRSQIKKKAQELGLKIGFTSVIEYEKFLPIDESLKGMKSIISLAMPISKKDNELMASFALDRDYHLVLQEKMAIIKELLVGFDSKSFVDNGPIKDRLSAYLSGLGYIGKSTMLITDEGTYFMLGEIVTTAELEIDHPLEMDCGNCTLCVDACPTSALPNEVYDKCLAGAMQRKNEYPNEVYEKIETIYGCDICQSVCPHNIDVTPRDEYMFTELDIVDILKSSKKRFRDYSNTAFYWLGHNVMKRNVIIYAANKRIDIDEELSNVNSKEEYMLSAIKYYKGKEIK